MSDRILKRLQNRIDHAEEYAAKLKLKYESQLLLLESLRADMNALTRPVDKTLSAHAQEYRKMFPG